MPQELSQQKLIYSTKELKEAGLSYYKITQLVKMKKINRLNKSYYENSSFSGDMNDFYYVSAFASDGVICLMSAAVYYNLTTFRPESIDVAVDAKKKIASFSKSISMTLHYFSSERLFLGAKVVTEGQNFFKIYDIEKTVVDIISNRNKIGIEETREILQNYLSRPEKNINKLYRYAKNLSCLKTLKTYLEVLI